MVLNKGGWYVRPLAGLALLLTIGLVIELAVAQFRGEFNDTAALTVRVDRAGLLMNKGGKVKFNGAQVGTVAAIDEHPDGTVLLRLAVQPSLLRLIPSNVSVGIESATVFGAKSVELVSPAQPSPHPVEAGQLLTARHVTVEVNTIFDQLDSVLSHIDPAKLNQTLGALAVAFNGRGAKFGKTLTDLNSFLATLEPSLPQLGHDIDTSVGVLDAYADATPDLLTTVANTTRISNTLVDERGHLDEFLLGAIGMAETGQDVLGANQQPLTDVLHLLVPTTDLTNEYHPALTCGLQGMLPLATQPPETLPGLVVLAGLSLGVERYRYPQNLPKVAAKGGPQCEGELPVPKGTFPPFLVSDVGANPWAYGNEGIVPNSDGLKQFLFGPIDGPPRNSAQIGQPG